MVEVNVDGLIYSKNIDVNVTSVDYNKVLIDESGGEIK